MIRSRTRRAALAAALAVAFGQGCYHYHLAAPNFDPATQPRRAVMHSIAWGLANNPHTQLAHGCEQSNAIDQVRFSSNLGFKLVTVVTLGFWAPVEVEWRCAKRQEQPGVIGAATSDADGPS